MKKIFTILLAVGSITFASAQSKNDWSHYKGNSRDIVYGQPNSRDIYRGAETGHNPFYNVNDGNAQIREINRQFDQRIQAVKWDRYLRNREKKQQIRMLQRQREDQIQQVRMRFSGRGQHDDDYYNRSRW